MGDSKQLVPAELIENKIHLIRGQKIMLDSDLAELYGIETKQLKRAVKRNIDRFPADFMFVFTSSEYESVKVPVWRLKQRRAFQISSLCLH